MPSTIEMNCECKETTVSVDNNYRVDVVSYSFSNYSWLVFFSGFHVTSSFSKIKN